MPEDPHKKILDRELYTKIISETHSDTIALLKEVINYGTNLLIRCYHPPDNKLKDAIILISLLKQSVSLSDSIEILISKASTNAAMHYLRTAF